MKALIHIETTMYSALSKFYCKSMEPVWDDEAQQLIINFAAPFENDFEYTLTAKAQISLRIRAVWSGPSLPANRIIGYYRM